MTSYRYFLVDRDSGQREPGEWLEAANDDEALQSARGLAGAGRCEVWLKDKLVGIVVR